MALAEEVVEEYKASLADLSFSSKPLINMLTMLAEDHEQHAPSIVKVIEDHINKCKRDKKLPALYLMDSIMKNLEKSSYRSLFTKNIVKTFTSVFEQVDEKTRASMYKLRQTWTSVMPNAILYKIDKTINNFLDPAWPITATEPEQTSIHVNPRFLQGSQSGGSSERSSPEVAPEQADDSEDQELIMRQQLIAKQQELISLKQARLELELAEAEEKLKLQRKQGKKPQSTALPTAVNLPLPPTVEEPIDMPPRPRDPRQRPQDPRLRDPRLQNQSLSSASSLPGSAVVSSTGLTSLPGQSSLSVGSMTGLPGTSESSYFPMLAHGQYPGTQMPTSSMPIHMQPYNGLQAQRMPFQSGVPPQYNAVYSPDFSGEVFEDVAKFSDDNDSDSSRSSFQEQSTAQYQARSNIRDPRRRIDQIMESRSDSDSSIEPGRSDLKHRNEGAHKDRDKHSDAHSVSHIVSKDPRLSRGRESSQTNRNSKDRDMQKVNQHSKDMPEKSASSQVPKSRSSSSDRSGRSKSKESTTAHGKSNEKDSKSVSKDRSGRSVSKEKTDVKSEPKLKDAFEADRKKKEQDTKKKDIRTKSKGDAKKTDKSKQRKSRDREPSPHKSPKQYSATANTNKTSEFVDEKKRQKSEDKNIAKSEQRKQDSAISNKKGNNKNVDKIVKKESQKSKESLSKTSQQEAMDVDERERPSKEPEKRAAVDNVEPEQVVKKPKLDDEQFSERVGDRYENESDLEVRNMDMDIESESEQNTEPEVPKIDEQFSDLFGEEDEDYRAVVPKAHLPLKSPSSKGWDQFKASQPEQYAYDIELKKQRQDSVVEERPHRTSEEPQDVDLRMNQPGFQQQMSGQEPEFNQTSIAIGGHSSILLQAHQKLKEGLITPEEHQDVLRNLGELMQLQEQHNRRLSGEMAAPSREQLADSDLRGPALPHIEPVQEPARGIQSPERPRESFRIPKKSRDVPTEDSRKELKNLYPESPLENRYSAHGPFNSEDNLHRLRNMDPRGRVEDEEAPVDEGPWSDDHADRRLPPGDVVRRGSPDRRAPEGPPDFEDKFNGPPDFRGPRRGEKDMRRGPHGDSDMRRHDGPPRDFNDRSPRDVDIDRRCLPDVPVPGGPFRDERGPEDWQNEGNWQDRRAPGGPDDHRGGRRGGFGRGLHRGGRRGPEFFEGRDYGHEEKRSEDEDMRGASRPENWREGDEPEQERGPWRRSPPGRFRDDERHPDYPRGRGWKDSHHDRREGDRPWKGRERDIPRPDDFQEGPQSWEDMSEDRWRSGPDGPGPRPDPGPRRLEGPFGRPGHIGEKEIKPRPSPKKDNWRGHPDLIPPNQRHPEDDDSRGTFGDERERRQGGPRHFHDRDMREKEFEQSRPKSLLEMEDIRPRGNFGGSRGRGIGPRPHGSRGPRFDGPNMDRPLRQEPPFQNQVDSYIDKFGDPRFRCFAEMGPVVNEEVVIGKRNFEIKLGAPPRKIAWGKDFIEVFADPSKRGIVIDNNLMYRFGERVKDVTIRGRKEKLFYHGRPLNLWLDGQLYEIRVDAPPKQVSINGKLHRIQIDGRDMMILIDKEEKGKYGGEPRFVFISDERMEMRFEPPPRHILIDGNLCELKLNMQQPCVNIKGVLHGIRFDGPPRDVFINGQVYQIFTDHAVKLRIGNRFHYVALGGPCHELIVDGKWFEVKFNEEPKEINAVSQILMVRLPGSPPEVKILPEISPIPPGGLIRPGMPMPGPMPSGFAGGPVMPMGGPPMPGMLMPGPPMGGPPGPGMPLPGPHGIPMSGPPGSGPMPGGPMQPGPMQPGPMQPGPVGPLGPMGMPVSSASNVSMSGPTIIPGIGPPQPLAAPMTSMQSGMPDVLSSLFPTMPAVSAAQAAPIDINSLFAKLVNTGIIKKEEPEVKQEPQQPAKPATVKPPEYANAVVAQRKAAKQEEKFEDIPDMTEMDPIEMKCLPIGMIQRLYAGLQCTSCGQRFHLKDGEKTEEYRQHLDWHFRQNRKEKADTKVTNCRKWYYGINDWIQYEEVSDGQEKVKNFFEQQPAVDTTPDRSQNLLSLIVPEGVTVTKCPPATGNDNEDMCNICHESFEQYWDEELEEWHLRDAIKVNSKTYHPICYEDFTDVSEGTPSPSALTITEPGFTSRKALTYDEASQDGHHASFEEERKVSTSLEPVASTSVSDFTRTSVSVKREPVEYTVAGEHVKIKQEPRLTLGTETDAEVHKLTNVFVKQEVKVEKMETESEASVVDDTRTLSQGSNSVSVTVKQEPIEEAVQPDIPVDPVVSVTMELETAEPQVSEVKQGDTETATEHNSELDSAITKPDAQEGDSGKCKESSGSLDVQAEELAAERDRSPSPFRPTNDETTSDINVDTCGAHLAPPEGAVLAQLSPTYSMLSKVKLAVTQEPLDISPEVLEIGSNASTPTRDELPSPLSDEPPSSAVDDS